MTVTGFIVFGVIDLSVLVAVKMICNAWVAVSATQKMGEKEVHEIMKMVMENMDDD